MITLSQICEAVDKALHSTLLVSDKVESEQLEIKAFLLQLHKSWTFNMFLTTEAVEKLKEIIDNNQVLRVFILSFLDRCYIEALILSPTRGNERYTITDEIGEVINEYVEAHNSITPSVIDTRLIESQRYQNEFVTNNAFAFLLMLAIRNGITE